MKKTFHLLYYIGFVAALWLLNLQFQTFVAVNGVLLGLLVGLLLAFLALLIFKTLTRVAIFLIVITGIVVFLFSVGFFTMPEWLDDILNMAPMIRERIGV